MRKEVVLPSRSRLRVRRDITYELSHKSPAADEKRAVAVPRSTVTRYVIRSALEFAQRWSKFSRSVAARG